MRTTATQVYVATPQKKMVEERLKLCRILWNANIQVRGRATAHPPPLRRSTWALVLP